MQSTKDDKEVNSVVRVALPAHLEPKYAVIEAASYRLLYSDSAHFDDLTARNRQLAQDIRNGTFEADAARHAQMRQHLVVTARNKLAAAYPKGLGEPQ